MQRGVGGRAEASDSSIETLLRGIAIEKRPDKINIRACVTQFILQGSQLVINYCTLPSCGTFCLILARLCWAYACTYTYVLRVPRTYGNLGRCNHNHQHSLFFCFFFPYPEPNRPCRRGRFRYRKSLLKLPEMHSHKSERRAVL
eukprot:COSAG01_NODE_4971_length_4580_cov_12.996206_1_plen_144_part_00